MDDLDSAPLSPEAKSYLRMREKGRRLPSRLELQQQLMDCEEALAATERALAETDPADAPSKNVAPSSTGPPPKVTR